MVPPGSASALGPSCLSRPRRNSSFQVGASSGWAACTIRAKARRMRSCSAGGSALGCSSDWSSDASTSSPIRVSMRCGTAAVTPRATQGRPHWYIAALAASSSTKAIATPRQFCWARTTQLSRAAELRGPGVPGGHVERLHAGTLRQLAMRPPWRVRSGQRTCASGTVSASKDSPAAGAIVSTSPCTCRRAARGRLLRPSKKRTSSAVLTSRCPGRRGRPPCRRPRPDPRVPPPG